MNKGIDIKLIATILATAATMGTLSTPLPSHSCGLEPHINGGFTVSHPDSLEVAVAVAKARNDGLLPDASTIPIPNDVRRQRLIADLQRLQSRLKKARNEITGDSAANFSVVLVGPGLWSHFHITAAGVLANYHTDGPLAGEVVVLTHETALRALLGGSLSIEQATELGLIAYSGVNTSSIKRTFEMSL